MVSKKILKMGTQKTPIEKTYGVNTGQDSLNTDFLGAIRQLDWIKYLQSTTKVTNTPRYI